MQRLLAAVLFWLVTVSGLHARAFIPLKLDELMGKSEIICNGIPTEIEESDKKYPVKYGNVTYSMQTVIATIQVIAVSKGSVPQKIQLRYPRVNGPTLNGPAQIYLQNGKRYRFYLKTVKDKPWYAGVCDGMFDDDQAVEQLADSEPDDSPPLLEAEAMRLAKQWLSRNFPAYAVAEDGTRTSIHYFNCIWFFEFYTKGHLDVRIKIHADRKVTYDSWLSEYPSIADSELNDLYLGKEVVIAYKPADTHHSNNTVARGVIEKITDQEIAGQFAPNNDPDAKRQFTTIKRKDLPAIQFIRTTGSNR